jgi:hypothetical protein
VLSGVNDVLVNLTQWFYYVVVCITVMFMGFLLQCVLVVFKYVAGCAVEDELYHTATIATIKTRPLRLLYNIVKP